MQPLAISQIAPPTDAGEASNVGSAQSNRTNFVGFNDLMSAARASDDKRRLADQESAAKRAVEQAKTQAEEKEAENTVAALSAAAKFAAQNVKLKQRAAEEERSRLAADHKETQKALTQAPDDSYGDPQDVSASNDSADKPLDNPAPLPAKVEASTKSAKAEKGGEQIVTGSLMEEQGNDAPDYVSGSDQIPTDAQVISKDAKDVVAVANDAALQAATQDTSLQRALVLDAEDNTLEKDDHLANSNKISIHATLKDVGKALNLQEQASDALTDVGEPTPSDLSSTKTGVDGDLMGGTTSEEMSTTAQSELDPSESQIVATNALVSQNATTQTINPAPVAVEQDPVLLRGRGQNEDPTANTAWSVPARQIPTPGKGEESTPTHPVRVDDEKALAQTLSAKDLNRGTAPKFEMGQGAPTDQDAEAPKEGADNTSSENRDDAEQQQQMANRRSSVLEQIKTQTGTSTSPQNQTAKGGANIQELAKLGLKEALISIETSTPSGMATQEQTLATPPSLTAGAQYQNQTAETSSSSSASSLERRTIAADIRLRALERMVVAAARAGTESITLQLYPPGLGQVMIRLVMDGQKLRIMTRAANAESVDALKDMEGDLRHALAGNGLDLAAFDVTDEKQDGEQDRRQKPAELTARTSGASNESFTVDLNA